MGSRHKIQRDLWTSLQKIVDENALKVFADLNLLSTINRFEFPREFRLNATGDCIFLQAAVIDFKISKRIFCIDKHSFRYGIGYPNT